MNTQILIVGAGPTGLALAGNLLYAGARVRIIDKKPGYSTTSKAIGLQYRVSEILACMGVADRFLAKGVMPTNVNIFVRDRLLVQLRFEPSIADSGRDAFSPKAIVIPQSETEQILGDLLRERGGQIEWNTEFIGFVQDETSVLSHLRKPDGTVEDVASEWLVSCEGAHSQIREQAGISFTGKTYPLAFLLADVELAGPLVHGENYVWMHKDGSFAALPLPKSGTWRLFVDVTKSPPSGEVSLDQIRKLMIERIGDRGITISNPTWISEFRIHCRMVDRYRNGRVFVAGDAAHVHSPTGGQGIVTGIQDAANLSWKLVRVLQGAPPRLLDTYEEERLPKAAEVLKETDRTTRLLLAPDPLTKLFRDFILLPVMRSARVQKKLFAKLAQLHVNYRGAALSRDEVHGESILKAGDRAPDVAFKTGNSDTGTTLFELLAPVCPIALIGSALLEDQIRYERVRQMLENAGINTFVLCESVPPGTATDHWLVDIHGDFRRLYGLSGEFLCVIRPDDHLGLVQSPVNETTLSDYCRLLAPSG